MIHFPLTAYPERVRRWREQDYPAIRDEAARLGILSGAA